VTKEEVDRLAADCEAFRQEFPAWQLWSTTRRLDWFSLWLRTRYAARSLDRKAAAQRLSDELTDEKAPQRGWRRRGHGPQSQP